MIQIDVTNHQVFVRLDRRKLREAVRSVLTGAGIRQGLVSLAVVDDASIRDVHRRHLAIDEPTDVLSFLFEREGGRLEGEIVTSAETAVATAPLFAWTAEAEILLYVVHGALHLVGHDDRSRAARAAMRRQERYHLGQFGLSPRYDKASRLGGGRAAVDSANGRVGSTSDFAVPVFEGATGR